MVIELEGSGIRRSYPKNNFDFNVMLSDVSTSSLADIALIVQGYIDNLDPSERNESHEIGGVDVIASIFIDGIATLAWEEDADLTLYITSNGEVVFAISVSALARQASRSLINHFSNSLRKFGHELIDMYGIEEQMIVRNLDEDVKGWGLYAMASSSDISLEKLVAHRHEIARTTFFPKRMQSSPGAMFEMIKLGGMNNLINMPESAFLEVKSAPYEMKRDKEWQCELAEDVARFANSEHGGLLLIGMRSKKIDGQDLIINISPIPISAERISRYYQTIDSRVHPPISNLQFESILSDTGEVLCILVPPQLEESKPFLVQGAFFDGKYQKGLISIVRRRDEHSIPVTAREIHAMLAAGRALLRGNADRGKENFLSIDLINPENPDSTS
ncbi:Putative DNA-binding domain-containing protein [Streptosporangium subroseum]|uniref:Putative DNA-binding domain-containing protein n=1 Tax=Streptosporangium subroseum TaxID=106412 RepID=A0A239NV35_9ACTN|nr:RNA-binding domain-containing protein [Streptosporangium subroseum]SNT58781.1 Putative DNA-binding domain-containing protein [Streptosporangium subroseum]